MLRKMSLIIVMISVIFSVMIVNSKELRAESLNSINSKKIVDFSMHHNSTKSPNADRSSRFEAYNVDIISHGFNTGRQLGYTTGRNIKKIWNYIKNRV